MEQDRRIGAGHWRGCHTFTDIICDGTTQSQSPARTGGLKMGGTYWYYVRDLYPLVPSAIHKKDKKENKK
jgi:hypothetical protein